MFSRKLVYLACLAAVSIPLSVSGQDTNLSPNDDVIMNAWSNLSDCNLANAKRVSFSDFGADAGKLLGECVAVEGYWHGRALFGSIRQANMRRSAAAARLRKSRIGLYAQWEKVGEPPNTPARTIFVGRVGQCETQWPDAMMVMGYCHYTGGRILLVSEAIRP